MDYLGVNEALVGMCRLLLEEGVTRETRGKKCTEIPYPVVVKITNPSSRIVRIPARKWNPYLAYAESLWLGLGWNNLKDLTGDYVKNLYNFSDDGETWRAGYGPRLRFYNGTREQYLVGEKNYKIHRRINKEMHWAVDQFEFVVESFKRDPDTRQAMITIADPNKDCFTNGKLITTKDMPCSRSIHFQKNAEGKLDMIVHMRSNDVLWGFSAVNVFNFTMMQEYFSYLVGLPMGSYFHIADNFHYYNEFEKTIEEIAFTDDRAAYDYDTEYQYSRDELTLSQLDANFEYALACEREARKIEPSTAFPVIEAQNDFFADWITVLLAFWQKKRGLNFCPVFNHPQLHELFRNRASIEG